MNVEFNVNLIYLLVPLALLAWLAWKNLPHALVVIVFLAPSYLIKSNIGFVPTTFLELSIYIVAAVALVRYFWGNILELANPFITARYFNWVIIVWLLAAALAVTASNDFRLSLGVFKGWWIDPIIFFYLLLAVIKTPGNWLKILNAFWASASLLAAYGLIEYGLDLGLQTDGLLNSVYNPANYLAMYLVPAIFVGVALTWSLWPSKLAKLNLFILLIDLWALFLTKSYGGFLGLTLGGAVFIWLVLQRQKKFRRKVFLFFLGILIVGGLVVSQQPKFQKLLSRDPRSSITTRQEIWQTSLILIKERPVIGWGLGNFQESYRSHTRHITLTPLEWFVVKAHNLYLNLWIEVGLLGLLTFLYFIGRYLWLLIPDLKSDIFGRRVWASALVAITVATLAHGLVDTPYFKNDLSFVFFIVIGVGLLLRYHSDWKMEVWLKN